MRNMKKIIFITICIQSFYSYSQDYFNPLFLGSDITSIDDLSYLTAGNNIAPGKYFLSVAVGEIPLGSLNVEFREDKDKKVFACFNHELINMIPFNDDILKKIEKNSANDKCLDLTKFIDSFSYDVNLSKLTLTLQIPQIYLKSIRSTLANESDWDDGIPVLLTNYNFNGSMTQNRDSDNYSSEFLNIANRLNIGSWRLNSSSYYNHNQSSYNSTHEWKTNNIFLTKNINPIKSTLTIGQSVLGSMLFDSNSYVGMSLATSNEMLPESEKGYSPVIKGIADSRSKITIRQNNNILYQEYINPGPYSIDDLNSVGSSGDYEVELTSDQGAVTKYIVPYSSLPNLLRHKRYNYSVALGRLDISQTDKSEFSQGTFAYGLPLDTTLYSGYQMSKSYLAFGLGLGKDIGDIGALSFDSIQAKAEINDKDYVGNSYRILYAKSFSNTGTNVQLTGYRYSTSNYYTLSEANYQNSKNFSLNDYDSSYRYGRKKDSFQINVTQSLNDYGQLYLWGNINSYWGNDTKSQNTQFGWNRSFASLHGLNVSASYNKNKYKSLNDEILYLSVSIPLSSGVEGNRMYINNSVNYNKSNMNNSTSIYGTALSNKLDYNIYQTLSNNTQNRSNLSGRYKANVADISFGTALTRDSREFDYGLSGSVLVHHDGMLMAREANDTAILVEAKGAEGAKLDNASENITINEFGYALIPYATPYHYNDVALSPDSFGSGYNIDGKVLKVAPTRGAISKVRFDVRKGFNFLVSLKRNNMPLKFGTLVTSEEDNSTSIVNDDSTVYLTGVRSGSKFFARIDKDNICTFIIRYDDIKALQGINEINLICH